jgi:hypothetical protein
MAINPLDAWKQHAMASEEMDLTGAGSHQKKGYNFAQNFPSLTPGGGVTATQWVGPALSKGYQYAQELSRSILPEGILGGTNIGLADAWKKAGVESDANIQGILGKGFDEDEYNDWMAQHGYGPQMKFKQQQLMNKKKQNFQNIIKAAEAKAAAEAAAKAKADAAAKYTAPRHHQDVSRNRGDHTAPTFRSEKKEGIDTKGSAMHGGKHYADGGLINFYRYGGFIG